ncbi:MAG: biosynthetic peptidoglycan transglycosylase [Owenweeksia sp.]|nr:biosynthetic peptidoglycan transglycosylase [Owenweeksia sp.]
MKKITLKRILIAFFALVLLVLAGGVLFYYLVKTGVFGPLPGEEDLTDISNATATVVYSSDGEQIGRIFAENRTNEDFKDLPNHLVNALVATEDARFFEHEGVDKRSLLRVLVKSILMGDESAGGGSTITQQLAKNLYGRKRFGFLSLPVNKTKEIILAQRLESLYSKEDIIELYLNTVPFSENMYGIETASQRFFSKQPAALQAHESAVLVGMLKANTYYNPRLHPDNARQRRQVVLHQMYRYGYLSEEKKILYRPCH